MLIMISPYPRKSAEIYKIRFRIAIILMCSYDKNKERKKKARLHINGVK